MLFPYWGFRRKLLCSPDLARPQEHYEGRAAWTGKGISLFLYGVDAEYRSFKAQGSMRQKISDGTVLLQGGQNRVMVVGGSGGARALTAKKDKTIHQL